MEKTKVPMMPLPVWVGNDYRIKSVFDFGVKNNEALICHSDIIYGKYDCRLSGLRKYRICYSHYATQYYV